MVTAKRCGFALVELIVVVTIAGIVATMAIATITRQQRFYRASAELRGTRAAVRDAMEILASDIRGTAVSDTIQLRADSAIELFAAIGGSVVCQTAGSEIELAPSHPFGNSLSGFLADPDTGDIALFYVDSADQAGHWARYRIASFVSRSLSSTCQSAFGLADDGQPTSGERGFSLTVASSLSSAIKPGAPVRFIRRVRYSLYRASDGASYLGYRRCNAVGPSVCGGIQPLSGPYRPFSSDARSTGLLFEYFDARANRLARDASPLDLARVVISARSDSRQRNPFSVSASNISDSGSVTIAVRNRLNQ